MTRLALPMLLCCGSLISGRVLAQADKQAANDPAHDELRKLRDDVEAAFRQRDFDRLVSYMHPDVVITFQNAVVGRKREGAKAYYEKMLSGPDSIVESMDYQFTVDELAILHGGDAAIAWGTLGDSYQLRDGMEVDLDSRWSATMVKEDGRWLVASAHGSIDAFDNDILRKAVKQTMLYAGGGGLAVGLIIGIVATWLLRRKKRTSRETASDAG